MSEEEIIKVKKKDLIELFSDYFRYYKTFKEKYLRGVKGI